MVSDLCEKNMDPEKIREYKHKYDAFRHHVWAGLGFLTVVGFVRIIFSDLSDLLDPILIILIIYIRKVGDYIRKVSTKDTKGRRTF